MESNGNEYPQLTLFAEDTHVSRSVTPANETAQTTHGTSGHDSSTPFAYLDPDSHCWRTCQGTLVSDLDRYSQTWPRSGMTHNGIAYQRQPSAPRTSATEYSLSLHHKPLEWTPTATANQMAPSMQQRNPGLRLWPTPMTTDRVPSENWQGGMTLSHAARMWPTPTAQDAKNSSLPPSQQTRDSIPGQLVREGMSGSLNPTWVEWLMGFPTGWTDFEA